MTYENEFRNWMLAFPHHTYRDSTILRYINALNRAEDWFNIDLKQPLLQIDSIQDFEKALESIKTLKNYAEINRLHGHGDFSAASRAYVNFLNNGTNSAMNNLKSTDNISTTPYYWLYSPGANAAKWDEFYSKGIMAIGWDAIGDLMEYPSKEAMKQAMKEVYDPEKSYKMSALATWQFSHEMKIGDIVFVKKGLFTVVGRGIVTSDYYFDETAKDEYKNARSVCWTHKGEWNHPGQSSMKTLTDVTQLTEYIEKLNALFTSENEEEEEEAEKTYPPYTEEDFLADVYLSQSSYHKLVGLLKRKKNLILQGTPGVGKTFAAKRIPKAECREIS